MKFYLQSSSIIFFKDSMSRQIDELKVYSDPKLKLKYEILNQLGQGCFGTVYKAINRNMKRQVAIKLELTEQLDEQKARRSNITNQIAIMDRLKEVPGTPKFYGAGKWSCGYYMQMQLLASNLNDERSKQFSQIQIYSMTSQLIQILKRIHEKGIIHQDLKPQNIMRNQKGALIIIDYGLSTIMNSLQGNQQKQGKKRGFVGTPRYASLAAHNGIPQRPKDDIQSLLYVIGVVYMKKAPWFELKGPASKRLDKICKYKKANSSMWLKQCGHSFYTAYQYLMSLHPNDKLDYNYLIDLFQSARKKKTLKTAKVRNQNAEKFKSPRRNSDFLQFNLVQAPKINIYLADNTDKLQSTLSNNNIQQISRFHNNFSQMAQDGYMELIQFLTEKIFNSVEQTEEDSAVVKTAWSTEPIINNVTKYEGLHFKNPFEAK